MEALMRARDGCLRPSKMFVVQIMFSAGKGTGNLKECVTIRFHKNLIPRTTAHIDVDLYFAKGYITAFHRLWQMDF
jgi:acyl-homoserine lactone acylase PvdQ